MPDAPSRTAPAERIGVALCTYNGARYLQAQLDSILDQDLPVNEVMIGDDGSSDQTLQLLQAFVPRAQALGIRVEIVQHAHNLGYVRNFADALMRCQADILFLCDQDDVWHPGRVRRYVQRFRAGPALLLLHSDARLVDAQGAPLGQRLMEVLKVHLAEVELERDGLAADVILQRNFVTGATCALRRRLVVGSLPVPAGWSHDEWLAVHASLRKGLDMLAEPTIDYRQHGNNQIGASRRGFLQRLRHLDLFDSQARAHGGACWPWLICWDSAAWWWRRALPGTSRARLAHGLVAPAAVSPRGCAGRLDRPGCPAVARTPGQRLPGGGGWKGAALAGVRAGWRASRAA